MNNAAMKNMHQTLVKNIRDYFKKNKFKKAVIGLSGGIDSSVSAVLVAQAIGHNNINGIIMPDIGLSSMQHYNDALRIANQHNIHHIVVPINNLLRPFHSLPWKESKFASMNVKARVRGVILYHYANSHNALVIGTSNKTEIMLGYFTKYGDGAVDVEVIGELWKSEVRELAAQLNIPRDIIMKSPTAELYHNHTDEREIGATYEEIDAILMQLEKGKNPMGKKAERIKQMVHKNSHKSLPIPVIKKK